MYYFFKLKEAVAFLTEIGKYDFRYSMNFNWGVFTRLYVLQLLCNIYVMFPKKQNHVLTKVHDKSTMATIYQSDETLQALRKRTWYS